MLKVFINMNDKNHCLFYYKSVMVDYYFFLRVYEIMFISIISINEQINGLVSLLNNK